MTDPPLGSEIRVPVAGFFLLLGLPRFYPFLANRPSVRIIRDRNSRKVRTLNSNITKPQLRNLRISPVILGSDYDEANPEYETGV
jgi:hypothetical protein